MLSLLRSILIAAMTFTLAAAESHGQDVPADQPYPVELTAGGIFKVCRSGEIICPARSPICDDLEVATPVDTPEGLGFKAIAPGSTLCSAQAGAGNALRRVFRITVQKEELRKENLQEKIELWADQLTTSKGSRLLYEIGQDYGYRILRGTKIVPILIEVVQPLVDNTISSEGQGEYIGEVIDALGHIGDERALPLLRRLEHHPIARKAIQEIEKSLD